MWTGWDTILLSFAKENTNDNRMTLHSDHKLSIRQCHHSPSNTTQIIKLTSQIYNTYQKFLIKHKKLLTYNFVEALIEDFAKKNNLLERWWVGKCSMDEVTEVKRVEGNVDFSNF